MGTAYRKCAPSKYTGLEDGLIQIAQNSMRVMKSQMQPLNTADQLDIQVDITNMENSSAALQTNTPCACFYLASKSDGIRRWGVKKNSTPNQCPLVRAFTWHQKLMIPEMRGAMSSSIPDQYPLHVLLPSIKR
eukprot:686725-Pelagomonas_calceolata.AAC.1